MLEEDTESMPGFFKKKRQVLVVNFSIEEWGTFGFV
jgi:hypothetical protein